METKATNIAHKCLPNEFQIMGVCQSKTESAHTVTDALDFKGLVGNFLDGLILPQARSIES